MAMNRAQGEEFVETLRKMQAIQDETRGRPDLWLERRDEHRRLVAHLDELSESIERL